MSSKIIQIFVILYIQIFHYLFIELSIPKVRHAEASSGMSSEYDWLTFTAACMHGTTTVT